jgi:hypothetical protein
VVAGAEDGAGVKSVVTPWTINVVAPSKGTVSFIVFASYVKSLPRASGAPLRVTLSAAGDAWQ